MSITVQDICYITCPKLKLKVILHYLDEPWVGRSKYRVEGVIFKYDPENDTITRIKDVPDKDVKARIDGCWISELYYTLAGSKVVRKIPREYTSAITLIVFFWGGDHRRRSLSWT